MNPAQAIGRGMNAAGFGRECLDVDPSGREATGSSTTSTTIAPRGARPRTATTFATPASVQSMATNSHDLRHPGERAEHGHEQPGPLPPRGACRAWPRTARTFALWAKVLD